MFLWDDLLIIRLLVLTPALLLHTVVSVDIQLNSQSVAEPQVT